jgi:hypothetical protein
MNKSGQKQTVYTNRIFEYVNRHQASLGLFLAFYGVVYLTSVLLGGWTIFDWGKDITVYPPSSINTLLPRSFNSPVFFVTSFPALIIGATMLCIYSVRGITPQSVPGKQYDAILLTVFGFTYIVIGDWPLKLPEFPWLWQSQIAANGPIFSWTLYLLSLAVFLVGVFSLYKHSRIYHQTHPTEDEQSGESVA